MDRDVESEFVILVVEDDRVLRMALTHIFKNEGFEVLEASSGRQGLEVATATPRLDLILTDVVMPDGDGRTMVRQLEALRPDVQVLFVTGLARLVEPGEVTLDGHPLLYKPFDINALLDTVWGVLGAKDSCAQRENAS